MTRAMAGEELAKQIEVKLPGKVLEWKGTDAWVRPEAILEVCRHLRDAPGLEFDFLNAVTGVDYIEYLEVVYHLTSLKHNHSAVLKARVFDRQHPEVPSVVSVWQGADLQEREVYDLMGIRFAGHPSLKRIFLWEGFQGHPLRKDYL